jgi:hypothetical protein
VLAFPAPLDPASLAAANISPVTGLATDYLNHFNEVAMLVGLLADMPEMAEEILAWRPRSYHDHFHVTGFREKELAVAAYDAADPFVRTRFDAACEAANQFILDLQAGLSAETIATEDGASLAEALHALIAQADGVIHARGDETASQDDIDALFD